MKPAHKAKLRSIWRGWVRPFLVILVVLSTLRSAVADWNDVPSGSMQPNILAGDRIFVNKLAYDLKVPFTTWHIAEWGQPQRGDIVVFYAPDGGPRMVKRLVGLPGDVIQLQNNRLVINGVVAQYAPMGTSAFEVPPAASLQRERVDGMNHPVAFMPFVKAQRRWFGPVTVPADHYFMLGDNRDNSRDSRWFGCVPRREILGRATHVALSVDRDHYYLPRLERFGRKLP